jgi:tetratricopeptide (TPR) repeat protein
VVFSGLIAWLVQGGSRARQGDDPITGGIGAPASADPGAAPMLTPEELAAMSPREAADRLFERAMREHQGGSEQSTFFANMAIDAYGALPPAEMDPDAYFHIGLLRLLQGDAAGAQAVAETILADNPRQLYGLLIAARAAALAGDMEGSAEYLQRARDAIAGGESLDDPAYSGHRPFIESQLASPGGAP